MKIFNIIIFNAFFLLILVACSNIGDSRINDMAPTATLPLQNYEIIEIDELDNNNPVSYQTMQVIFNEPVVNLNSNHIIIHEGSETGPIISIESIIKQSDHVYLINFDELLTNNTKYYVVINNEIKNTEDKINKSVKFKFISKSMQLIPEDPQYADFDKISFVISANETPYALYYKDNKLHVTYYDGIQWNTVGEEFSAYSRVSDMVISSDNIPYIAYFNDRNLLIIKKYDPGIGWINVGHDMPYACKNNNVKLRISQDKTLYVGCVYSSDGEGRMQMSNNNNNNNSMPVIQLLPARNYNFVIIKIDEVENSLKIIYNHNIIEDKLPYKDINSFIFEMKLSSNGLLWVAYSEFLDNEYTLKILKYNNISHEWSFNIDKIPFHSSTNGVLTIIPMNLIYNAGAKFFILNYNLNNLVWQEKTYKVSDESNFEKIKILPLKDENIIYIALYGGRKIYIMYYINSKDKWIMANKFDISDKIEKISGDFFAISSKGNLYLLVSKEL